MQSRSYGGSAGGNSMGNFVFGNNVSDTGTPPLLDLSEFPSLTTARGHDQSMPSSNVMQPPGSKPYGTLELSFGVFFLPFIEPLYCTFSGHGKTTDE